MILAITGVFIYVLSTVFIVIHLYKFFHSINKQSLATKNLTLYCFFLIVIHFWVFFLFEMQFFLHAVPSFFLTEWFVLISFQYLVLTTTFFKFIMAVDLCWSFRKVALYLQAPSVHQDGKFLVYGFLGTSFPLLCTAVCTYVDFDYLYKLAALAYLYYTTNIIRILRLIPILGAFWYIRSASMSKAELWKRFSLHMRLIIMLGGFSAVFGTLELFLQWMVDSWSSPYHHSNKVEITEYQKIYFYVDFVSIFLEGIVIGIFFTFKDDTFKSKFTDN